MRPLKTTFALALAEYERACDRADAVGTRSRSRRPFMCHVVSTLATRGDITRAEADFLMNIIEDWIDHHATLYIHLKESGLPSDRDARRAFYRAKLADIRG